MFHIVIIGLLLLIIAGILTLPKRWNLTLGIGGALALMLVLAPKPALAAAIVIPQVLWDQINQVVIGVVVALLLMLFKWLNDRSPLKNAQAQQITRDAFNAILYQGAKFGLTQLQKAETHVDGLDVGNAAVAAGANYVIAQAPGIAAKLGIDVSTEEGRASVIRMVTARVGDLMTPPHEAPAMVPLPTEVQPVTPPAA